VCLPGSNHGTLRGLLCDEGRGAAVDVRSMCIERERPVRTHRAQGPRVKGGERWEHSSLDCRVVWVCAACACCANLTRCSQLPPTTQRSTQVLCHAL